MSKILLTADLHIHPHRSDSRRVEDGLECLRWIYETATKKDCSYLIIAGDFLHNRFQLPLYAYSKACKIVADHKTIPTIFLLGNHDLYYEDKWDVHSLTPLKEWATVIDEPTSLFLHGTQVDFLPYTPTPSRYLPTLGDDAKGVTSRPDRVLISHLAVAEALLNVKYDIRSVEDDSKEKETIGTSLFSKWKKTWLGHYHCGQKLGHGVEYIGSPMQLTYGEAGQQKHVAVFDLETFDTDYVVNDTSPKFHIIDNPEQVNKIDVNDSYVKFRCGETIESKFAFRKELSKLGAREIEFDTPKKDIAEVTGKALLNITAIFSDKPKLIQEYLKGVALADGLDASLLEKVGVEIVNQS